MIYDIPNENFTLHGLIYDKNEGFIRMPGEIAGAVSQGVLDCYRHTSGGRLIFSTNSSFVEIHVKYDSLDKMYHMPLTGQAGFMLCEKTNVGNVQINALSPTFGNESGFTVRSRPLDSTNFHTYILYFPLYNGVKSLRIALSDGATFGKPLPYRDIKPILYYGSSITQGGCASRPDNSYQALISDRYNVDYIDLGFSGAAKAEDSMIDYLKTLDCSIFVLDYDHNAPDADHLLKTHEKLFLAFRETHPAVPVIMVTRPDGFQVDDSARVSAVKRTYLNAKKRGDKNVYFIDGRKFFPASVRYHCLVDTCHPNDMGFYFMAEKIGGKIGKILENI